MAMKYLPIHSHMENTLKAGMNVVHNGGNNRQGLQGVITSVRRNDSSYWVDVRYTKAGWDNGTFTVNYSKGWFLKNFYISIGDVKGMGGFFNGIPYLAKYAKYSLCISDLRNKRHTHSTIKKIVDGDKVKDKPKAKTVKDTVQTKVELPKQGDGLDTIGEYLCIAGGKCFGIVHKTQRIAEIAASAYATLNSCRVGVVKVVSDVISVHKAEIIRK